MEVGVVVAVAVVVAVVDFFVVVLVVLDAVEDFVDIIDVAFGPKIAHFEEQLYELICFENQHLFY